MPTTGGSGVGGLGGIASGGAASGASGGSGALGGGGTTGGVTTGGGTGGGAAVGGTSTGGEASTGGAGVGGAGVGGAGVGGSAGGGGEATGGGVVTPPPTAFDNPIIKYDAPDPTNGPGDPLFTADGAAMVWEDRVYLYTGHDEQAAGGSGYLMYDYYLFASSDLLTWENQGAVMRADTFDWARTGDVGNANAAEVVHRDDESGNPKFYFYAPVEGGQPEYGISIGVAVADRPEGPFTDPRGMPLILLGDTAGISSATHTWRNLDPTVFVDDDGRVYMYWGNAVLYWVELESDMIHLKGETYTTAGGIMENRSTAGVQIHVIEDLENYTEAPFLSKRGDLYYLTYASGFPETTSYATSSSPEGPWQARGMIVDRVPNSDTVHQSVFDFHGASFITYHNGALPTGGPYRRSTCLDRLYFNEDGTIQQVVQTTQP